MEAHVITAKADEEVTGWFYVEIFGHTVVCGRITTRKFGTAVMFQIDIPDGDQEFSHSQLLNPSSVFSMTPTTEEYCRKFNFLRIHLKAQED